MILLLSCIQWDAKAKDAKKLPAAVLLLNVKTEDLPHYVDERVGDWLSDEFGFTHHGFDFKPFEVSGDQALGFTVNGKVIVCEAPEE